MQCKGVAVRKISLGCRNLRMPILWREMPLSGKMLPCGMMWIKSLCRGLGIVRHAKRLKRLTIPPILTGDDLVRLCKSLGGWRMGAEISGQALNGELREFLFGRASVNDVLLLHSRESFE
jgi:hypothetical protein